VDVPLIYIAQVDDIMQLFIKMRLFQLVALCAFFYALPVESWSQLTSTAEDKAGFAFLVDVSSYRDANIPALRGKSNEVHKIKNALHLVGGFPEGQIQVLAGENATREGLIEALTNIVARAERRANNRFLFYLKGRSVSVQGKKYFLPYDARLVATSTYIEELALMNWFDRVRLRMKALILARWNKDDQDEKRFSSELATILSDEKTDADGNRNVTLGEVETKIRALGFGENLVRIDGDRTTIIVRLPSVLKVTSQPPGAAILLDGAEKGVTPKQFVGLMPGTHRLLVKKELYRMPEERAIEITMARGQQMNLPLYQLAPIRVYGTTEDADKKVVAKEVYIDGTGYRQDVGEDGKFNFDNWQSYGILESGREYELIASADGMDIGEVSFTFGGTEDIRLVIPLTKINWIDWAMERLRKGDDVDVEDIFKVKLPELTRDNSLWGKTLSQIPPELAPLLLANLEEELQGQPDNLRWRLMAAELADLAGDIPAAKEHWEAVKAKASKESQEYKQAVARLKELSPSRRVWFFALVACGVVILSAVGFFIRKRNQIGEYQEIPNPYIAGKPISEEEMFFGREDVFNFIKEQFSRSQKDITIVLHGGRRTGKTSILYQIANGRLGEDFVPVFIDMQEMAGVDAHDFFRRIAQKISEVHRRLVGMSDADETRMDDLCRALEDKTKPEYESFNEFLTHVASTLENKYLIFLIDEYEIIRNKVNEGDLSVEIFSYLRHLMQNINNLAFIFSGSSVSADKEWALMFNMAQPKEVSFLSKDDAIALITTPVQDFVRYDKKAVDLILRVTAGQPFFAQAVCLHIIEYLNDKEQNRVTTEHVDEAYDDIVENPPPHLTYIWSELTAAEKITIALLAETLPDETAYASVDDIVSKLASYDLQYSRADISKNLARLLEEHLIEKKLGTEIEAYRFRMDLTRGWLQAEHSTWGVLKEVQDNNE
jgi:hypothetical protein